MGVSYPSAVNYFQEVAEGNVLGHTSFIKVGFNSVVGSTIDELISGAGSSSPYMPTAALNIEALSGSSLDTSTGTGVRTIFATGLDANFNEISEAITLSGTSPVISVQKFIRVYAAISVACGTYRGANAGDITIRGSSGGTTFLLIVAQQGTALTSHYCVPAGKSLTIHSFFVAIEGSKNVSITVWAGPSADVVTAPFVPVLGAARNGGLSAIFEVDFGGSVGTPLPAMTDFWVTGTAATGSAAVTVSYACVLKSN